MAARVKDHDASLPFNLKSRRGYWDWHYGGRYRLESLSYRQGGCLTARI